MGPLMTPHFTTRQKLILYLICNWKQVLYCIQVKGLYPWTVNYGLYSQRFVPVAMCTCVVYFFTACAFATIRQLLSVYDLFHISTYPVCVQYAQRCCQQTVHTAILHCTDSANFSVVNKAWSTEIQYSWLKASICFTR